MEKTDSSVLMALNFPNGAQFGIRYTLRPEVGSDFPYDAVRTPADYTWAPGAMEVPVYRGLPYPLWGLTARITMHFIQIFQEL